MANGRRTNHTNRSSSSGKSDGNLRDSDLAGWLIGFLFFALLVGGVFRAIQDSFGNDELGIGAIVYAVGEIDVWEEPGAGDILGTQSDGAEGEVTDGPEEIDNVEWWYIDFEEDPDGWVREFDIILAPSGITELWERFIARILLPSVILSVLLIVSVIVLSIRIRKLVVALREKYQTPDVSAFVKSKEERAQGNERWERVQELVHSPDAGNWRLAILEADIMLTDIVSRMGYSGEGLGEQLKQVEKSDFTTLDKAWEAHKVRNTIAHEGGDFILTQREARRIIGLYEDVFREFHYL